MNNQLPNTNQSDSVKARVFDVIETGGVEPRSKLLFCCQNWLVWGLWGLSIVFGALSVAVLLFVSTHRYYDIYEATHENFVTFMLEALPFVWLGMLVVMLLLATRQLKHTKRGYRLSATVLGVSSLAFSVVLGGLFHLGGFGWSLDRWLGQVAPMYASQAKMEQKMWQNPAAGRLVGRQLVDAGQPMSTVVFVDVDNVRWVVQVVDLSDMDQAYLQAGNKVRLLGTVTGTSTDIFHACGVFPWMLDEPAKIAQVSTERQAFVDRMYQHHENAEARQAVVEEALAQNTAAIGSTSPCYALPAVRRVHERMH